MRTSFFAALVILSTTFVSAAPLPGITFPTIGKGGNAQSGYSGSVNGGVSVNQGAVVSNGIFASEFSSAYP